MPALDIQIEQLTYAALASPRSASNPTAATPRRMVLQDRELLWARALERGSERGYDAVGESVTTEVMRRFLVSWRPPGSFLATGDGVLRRIVDENGEVWEVREVDEATARRRHLVELRCYGSSLPVPLPEDPDPEEAA